VRKTFGFSAIASTVVIASVLAIFCACSRSSAPATHAAAAPAIPTHQVLPTGMTITPLAPHGASFYALNPHLPDFPDFIAGQPVSLALSPDCKTLLVLTSGYNRNNGPNGRRVADASNEYVFVYDVSGSAPRAAQILQIPNTFDGIAWNPNGSAFYVSGGVDDDVHVFEKSSGAWKESGPPIPLEHRRGLGIGVKPEAAGLAVTPDGRRLLVANFENDSVSLVDLSKRRKIAELDLRPGATNPREDGIPGGEYPFWVVIHGNRAWVSSPRDRQIVVLDLAPALRVIRRIAVPGQPNRMILNRDGSRLFAALGTDDVVAEIDTRSNRVMEEIPTTAPHSVFPNPGKLKGANPNSLALSPDQKTLYVTNGGANSIAVISLAAATARKPASAHAKASIEGLIPTAWYPDSIAVSPDGRMLYVSNTRSDPGPNPRGCRAKFHLSSAYVPCGAANQYILQLTKGGLWSIPTPDAAALRTLTNQVAENDHYRPSARLAAARKVMAFLHQHIHHVIYIVKENRTYDQVLGDLPEGNGDPNLTLFPQPITPNFHQVALDFVDLDNTYASGEVSGDGWNWTTAARANQFVENMVPVNYANRGLSYDFQGGNRNINVGWATLAERRAADPGNPDDPNLLPGTNDIGAPDGPGGEAGAGYLWNDARHAHLTMRNYGWYSLGRRYSLRKSNPAYIPPIPMPYKTKTRVDFPDKAALMSVTDPYYRSFDQSFPDYWRYQEWDREFQLYVKHHDLPAFEMLWMPHDHFGDFGTAIDGVNTPEKQIADNDYAVGLLVQQIAHSPYRNDTLIFIIEDDAQNGPDHVDAHRTTAFIIGPYVKQHAVVSTHYTTVNMVKTIEDVLGMGPMGINDDVLSPMADAFTTTLKPWTYTAIVPAILRTTRLPLPPKSQAMAPAGENENLFTRSLHSSAYWAAKTKGFDFAVEDHINTPLFNHILWTGLMGPDVPYPAARSGKDLRNHRKPLLARYRKWLVAHRQALATADGRAVAVSDSTR
jgi:DNA-binding beta-propeller fold protein YncE